MNAPKVSLPADRGRDVCSGSVYATDTLTVQTFPMNLAVVSSMSFIKYGLDVTSWREAPTRHCVLVSDQGSVQLLALPTNVRCCIR